MGHTGMPRRGSLAFWPRKRSSRIYPQLTSYAESEKPKVNAFAGYKAGMGQLIVLNTQKGTPTFGMEVALPVTILDCPPMRVVGIRAYENSSKGLRVMDETWVKDLPKEFARKMKTGTMKTEEKIGKIEGAIEKVVKLRLIVATQPRLSGIGKKKPEIFEVEVGGKDAKEKFDFAKQILGKEIPAKDVVKEGELVDVVAITKGKGTAGPVKRFGVRIGNRHAKKKLRHVGSLGQERPGKVRPTVAMAGQLGFQRRTEMNKRVLKVGESGNEITPKSGFKHYGILKNGYVVVEGSVPGARKRLIMLRSAIRPSRVKMFVPEIREVIV